MLNRKFFVLYLMIALVSLISCSNNDEQLLNGTWIGDMEGFEIEMTFNNGELQATSYFGLSKGTYSVKDGYITMQYDNYFLEEYNMFDLPAGWYDNDEFVAALKAMMIEHGYEVDEDEFEEFESIAITPPASRYTVTSKKLTIFVEYDGGSETMEFRRK